eukprot:2183306-Alexandrium_andersonii.AAC.1
MQATARIHVEQYSKGCRWSSEQGPLPRVEQKSVLRRHPAVYANVARSQWKSLRLHGHATRTRQGVGE